MFRRAQGSPLSYPRSWAWFTWGTAAEGRDWRRAGNFAQTPKGTVKPMLSKQLRSRALRSTAAAAKAAAVASENSVVTESAEAAVKSSKGKVVKAKGSAAAAASGLFKHGTLPRTFEQGRYSTGFTHVCGVDEVRGLLWPACAVAFVGTVTIGLFAGWSRSAGWPCGRSGMHCTCINQYRRHS